MFEKESESLSPYEILNKTSVHLLEYFVYHKNKILTKEQLIDTFWNDSINPESVVKYSIHRLRQVLCNHDFFECAELIATNKNGYSLNHNIKIDSDIDEVNQLLESSQNINITANDRMQLLNQIIDIIDKPFLGNSSSLLWVIPIREYYNTLFNRCLKQLIENAQQLQDYHLMLQLSQRGIQVDQYFEDHHYYYISALVELKQFRKAIEYYQSLNHRFYREFQTSLSMRMKNLYTFMMSKEQKEHTQLTDLLVELNESNLEGSYYCDYEVFKRYFHIAKRTTERSNLNYCIVLFELEGTINDFQLATAVRNLTQSIQTSLRKGDVFTQMNLTQCILLLPCQTIQNAKVITNRILKNYSLEPISKLITPKLSIKILTNEETMPE